MVLLAGVCLLALSSGCSGGGGFPTAPVTGKVTSKGKEVPNGTVLFIPDSGPAATGEIGKDGTYSLGTYGKTDGAVLGHHKVAITALEEMGDALLEARSPTPASILPNKSLNQDTSGLTFDVKSGDNVANFEIKD